MFVLSLIKFNYSGLFFLRRLDAFSCSYQMQTKMRKVKKRIHRFVINVRNQLSQIEKGKLQISDCDDVFSLILDYIVVNLPGK